jgi:hypothetical protein
VHVCTGEIIIIYANFFTCSEYMNEQLLSYDRNIFFVSFFFDENLLFFQNHFQANLLKSSILRVFFECNNHVITVELFCLGLPFYILTFQLGSKVFKSKSRTELNEQILSKYKMAQNCVSLLVSS